MTKIFLSVVLFIPLCCISASNNDRERENATSSETHCLAIAIHKEARGESPRGQRAVYDVILNRMRERGLSACAVIKQTGQLPWAASIKIWKATEAMLNRLEIIETFVEPSVPDNVMYFNNAPFRKIGKFYTKIGNQWFYTEKPMRYTAKSNESSAAYKQASL